MEIEFFFLRFCSSRFGITGQWTQSAIKHQMCSCHHTIRIHHVQRIQHIHTIEWHFQIRVNVCPVHILSIQHQVHMKSDVFRHHVVFQKRPFLPEGKHWFSHRRTDTHLHPFSSFICLNIKKFPFTIGVMYHEHHIVVHKKCQLAVVAVEQHHGL